MVGGEASEHACRIACGRSEVSVVAESRKVSLGSDAVAGRRYANRAERQDVLFPVLFRLQDGEEVQGTCENLSESGLLATFAAPMDIWTHGLVDLSFGGGLLGVRVRVARVDGLHAGLAFQDMDEAHRSKVRELMVAARDTGYLPDHL